MDWPLNLDKMTTEPPKRLKCLQNKCRPEPNKTTIGLTTSTGLDFYEHWANNNGHTPGEENLGEIKG